MSDLISREEAIKAFSEHLKRLEIFSYLSVTEYVKNIANTISSAEKVGEWLRDDDGALVCSICDYPAEYNPISNDFIETNYCPNCGARMEERKWLK